MAINNNQLPVAGMGGVPSPRTSGIPDASLHGLKPVKKQPDIITHGLRPVDFLYAMRRRWTLALALGLLMAATTALIAWCVIPVQYYEAKVWLRVAKSKPKIIYDTRVEEHYLNDRNAQPTLIRSNIVLNTALRQPEIAQLSCLKNEKEKARWLSQHLRVGYLGQEILQISISGEKREDLLKILHAVRAAYMDEVVSVDRDLDSQRRAVLERAYRNMEKQITKKQTQYQNLAEQLGTPDSKNAGDISTLLLGTVTSLRSDIYALRAKISGIDRNIALLKAHLKKYPDSENTPVDTPEKRQDLLKRLALSALAQDPEFSQTRQELQYLTREIKNQEKLVRNPDNSPSILKLRKRISDLTEGIERRVRELTPVVMQKAQEQLKISSNSIPMTPAEQLRSKIDSLNIEKAVYEEEMNSKIKSFEQAVTSAEQFSTNSTDLDNMKTELVRLRSMYHRMGSQLDEWAVESQAGARVSTINEPETTSTNNIKTKIQMVIFLSLASFFGTVLAVGGLDFLGRRVNSADELSFGLGIHVMGDLPLISRGVHRKKLNHSIQGLLMESIDNIRTALLHRAEQEGMRAVLVTSSLEKEGKTTVSSQLAASLARTGRRVLLVDADLRRPSAHRMFDRPLSPGLAEFLRGLVPLDETITATRVENLWFIPAGKPHPDAIINLAQGGMEEPMQTLRKQFDFLVVDSGPILTDADVLVIGRLCDGMIMSVLRDVSRLPWVYEACERIRMVDIPLIGTVLNGVSFGKYRPYYSSYTIEVHSNKKKITQSK